MKEAIDVQGLPHVISDTQSSFILVNIEKWMYILAGQIQ